jgi:hypothetical protein
MNENLEFFKFIRFQWSDRSSAVAAAAMAPASSVSKSPAAVKSSAKAVCGAAALGPPPAKFVIESVMIAAPKPINTRPPEIPIIPIKTRAIPSRLIVTIVGAACAARQGRNGQKAYP